jgi:hypothetical protein
MVYVFVPEKEPVVERHTCPELAQEMPFGTVWECEVCQKRQIFHPLLAKGKTAQFTLMCMMIFFPIGIGYIMLGGQRGWVSQRFFRGFQRTVISLFVLPFVVVLLTSIFGR